jgi:hypothetical protein
LDGDSSIRVYSDSGRWCVLHIVVFVPFGVHVLILVAFSVYLVLVLVRLVVHIHGIDLLGVVVVVFVLIVAVDFLHYTTTP